MLVTEGRQSNYFCVQSIGDADTVVDEELIQQVYLIQHLQSFNPVEQMT